MSVLHLSKNAVIERLRLMIANEAKLAKIARRCSRDDYYCADSQYEWYVTWKRHVTNVRNLVFIWKGARQ